MLFLCIDLLLLGLRLCSCSNGHNTSVIDDRAMNRSIVIDP